MITKIKATVIGWYGTETIGDRAILAGIIRLLSEVASDITIDLGSLYPILSERTLSDDGAFFEQCAHQSKLKITLFDSQKRQELERSIKHSDVTIMGGGPLMDIEQMYMVGYAFSYARRRKKKTILLGCGYGPLEHSETIACANRILDMSDLSIMRDTNAPHATATNLIDPAAFACLEHLSRHPEKATNDFYAINIRDISAAGGHYPTNNDSDKYLIEWLQRFVNEVDKPIQLVPMHTFSVGGDDRIILNRVAKEIHSPKVEILTFPPSLEETMSIYRNARLCIGMRFHAVLMQTILNGNNIILDYTDPKHGKIIELMRQLNIEDAYRERYLSVSQVHSDITINPFKDIPYELDMTRIEQYLDTYTKLIAHTLER
ncbi:MAG: polysaccharide pyruvyl transferase family protein [Elusimicrobiaceae bacterium]|nr:polysaccharide pyruvyl transferase family protein [Elusimicrobiaceae bacterium]